jgi:hypothetical protein
MRTPLPTSPLWGEVDIRAEREYQVRGFALSFKPPHPALCADLSPQGRGEGSDADNMSFIGDNT